MNTPRLQDAIGLYQQGRLDEAGTLCAAVLANTPHDFDALHLAGVIAFQRGDAKGALTHLDAALAVSTVHAAAHNTRGMALLTLGRAGEALAAFDAALALKPSLTAAHNNRGNALRMLKRLQEAVTAYDTALAARADYAEALSNKVLVLLDLKNHTDARSAAERAVAVNPNSAEAHHVLGLALKALRDDHAALASYERATALKPDLAEAWSNRGIVLQSLERNEAALASFDRALALQPEHAEAWSNRGVALVEQGRGREAIASFERCIALAPDNADARWNLSLCHLQQGDFTKGWALHEARWQAREVALAQRAFTEPAWRGEPIAGKTLLLHADQGFGDAVHFIRYAKPAHDLGARVIVEVRAPLVRLAETMEGVAQVVAHGAALPAFDLQCPMGSLPQVFGMTAENVPLAGGYLQAPEEHLARWRARLGPRIKPRVGLAWTGNPTHKNNHNRSIALGEMVTLLSPAFDFFSLQKQMMPGDRAILAAHPALADVSAEVADFADTAALCTLMDVVVTVDTSVAHIAGALGKPVWIMLPFSPDWRWMLGRADTPWYASAKLYRQRRPGDWAGVLSDMRADLKRL